MAVYSDIRTLEFVTLSDVKARLSEFLKRLIPGQRRIVVTTNGRPEAVLLSYEDYLGLLPPSESVPALSVREPEQIPMRSIEEWRKERPARQAVVSSIRDLFDMNTLSRKGQKAYKQERVRGFVKQTKK